MLLDKLSKTKKVIIAVLLAFISINVFVSAEDLSDKYLAKADTALENEDIPNAYKYINAALGTEKDTSSSHSKIVYLAQTIYAVKLQNLLENAGKTSDLEIELVDIQGNLDKYPEISNTKIKKLLKQIEVNQDAAKEIQRQKEREEDLKNQQKALEVQKELQESQERNMRIQQESNENFAKTMEETTNALREQNEASKKQQAEFKEALTSGLKDMGDAFTESAEQTKQSTKVIALSVILIAVLIIIIIMIVLVIVKIGFQKQREQQAQYQDAYLKVVTALAQGQSQTNTLLLGGITDLYGQNPTLKLAGSSTWESPMALPDVEFSAEDEKDLQELAVKCEDIGSKIDQATGRKNNSKNVSELVYKMSMSLGLPKGMSMLNFCAAMIYDAGFLALDPSLLTAETLDEEQKKAMKEHVNLAEKYLDFVPKKYWSVFEDAATKHHENMDGTGYPKGLKGDDIPQIARLIRAAETYVSLSSKRNYRQTMDKESAIQILRDQPHIYDPQVVTVLDAIL